MEIETRTGSGSLIKMTKEKLRTEIEAGSNDAAEKAHIPALTGDEVDHILEIMMEPSKIVSVERGKEVVLSRDGGVLKYTGCTRYAGAPLSKEQAVSIGERIIGLDTMELGHADYSIKPCKAIAFDEAHHMENAQMVSIIPLLYGAMPNLGTYYQSLGGPWSAPTDLLKQGKIKESRETQEHAAEDLQRDIIYLAKIMYQSGSDGMNFDTTAAAGDAEFYATLNAIEKVKSETNLAVEVGMAGEMILGMHCELDYQGTRLAGLWPHQQAKLVEKSGASMFGPVVNTRTTKSFPWNLGRSVPFIKAVTKAVQIPVHCNMGMGVCGVPMTEITPVDAVTRAAKAMIEIADIDGIQLGVGDAAGIDLSYRMSFGMGGLRTSGDLVARTQMEKKLKIREAKAYVAKKLDVEPITLSDEYAMTELRKKLDIGLIMALTGYAKGLAAKARIAKTCDFKINSVARLFEKTS